MTHRIREFAGGFGYLEAARWRDGALWFSDLKARAIHRATVDGAVEVVAKWESSPCGLGFRPDGSMLVVDITDQVLVHLDPMTGERESVADLRPFGFHANDLAVDSDGTAYVTQIGYNWFEREPAAPTQIIVVRPDGSAELSGGKLQFPNGIALSGDERTLFVSESFAHPSTKLSALSINPDGSLGARETIREFGPSETHVVDGICVDAEDNIWVSLCMRGEFEKVSRGGETLDVISVPAERGNYVVDSTLDEAGRSLYMLIAEGDVEKVREGFATTARIDVAELDGEGR